jgi:DNA replication ATP-dependent helicase Dna2
MTKGPYSLPAKHAFFPLCKSRTLFIESLPETVLKRNKREAQMVLLLVKMLTEDVKISLEDIGIITPFRAQIVEIKKLMPEAWQANEHFVIDTVERFQGGQKKVIIFSTTISNPRQTNSIQSITTGDIPATDRKLLVGLSRAEEQVIILGNPDALCVSDEYKALMEACKQNEGYLDRAFTERILL